MGRLILVMIILALYDVCLVKIAINYERKEAEEKDKEGAEDGSI